MSGNVVMPHGVVEVLELVECNNLIGTGLRELAGLVKDFLDVGLAAWGVKRKK